MNHVRITSNAKINVFELPTISEVLAANFLKDSCMGSV